ncbi:MAG: competence protein ComEC [Verrucomicrobiota bacterium]|jgi:ComEC/Rec2-related protein
MKFLVAPRQPFVGLVLCATTGIFIADFCQLSHFAINALVIAVLVCGFVLLCWPHPVFTYGFVAVSFFLLHIFQTSDTAGSLLAARLGERARAVTVTGAVITEPKFAPNGFATFLLHLNSMQLEGKNEPTKATILVRWRGKPEFGDELQLFGTASPIDPPRNPGEFDMRSYLERRDIRRVLFVRYEEDAILLRSGGGNPVLRAAHNARSWLQSAICRGLNDSPEVMNFLGGITLGLRHQTPEDIEEPFQQTGTLHLFAVAGLHVGIVAELLWLLSKVIRLSRRWASALIIPILFFYSAVTGLHISSIRAAIMSAVLLGGFLFERRVFTFNSLAAAAMLLLCWNTNELFSTGFQLSFSVVAAIVLLADPVGRFFRRYTAPDSFLPRTLLRRPRRIVDAISIKAEKAASVSIAAWIGSLALLLWGFYLITPISLLANLLVVPIAFFILAIALLSVMAAPLLPWFSVVFNNANWFLAQTVLVIVHALAQIPGGHYYVAHPPWLGHSRAQMNVLDLGAGAAVHLHTARGDWLFDCGSERDYDRVLRPYLHASGINKLSGLLLSHGDSLHIGGAAKLVSDLPPSLLIDNPVGDRSGVHKRLRRLFEDHRLTIQTRFKGDNFSVGDEISGVIFHPPAGFSASVADDQAFVVQLRVGRSARILLMSDSGAVTENALLSSGLDLRSDILVKGRHHSAQSGSDDFVRAVRPRLIIATSRDFPQHERIPDEWADRVRGQGIKLFRQDETGAVEIRFLDGSWEARAFVTGETFRSSSR